MSIVARVLTVHDGASAGVGQRRHEYCSEGGDGGGGGYSLCSRGVWWGRGSMRTWVARGCSLLALFKAELTGALCWSRSTASEGRKEKREGGLSSVTVNCISDQCFRCPGPDQSDPPCHGAEERATDTITASNGLINSLCGVSRRSPPPPPHLPTPCRSRAFFPSFFHLTGEVQLSHLDSPQLSASNPFLVGFESIFGSEGSDYAICLTTLRLLPRWDTVSHEKPNTLRNPPGHISAEDTGAGWRLVN